MKFFICLFAVFGLLSLGFCFFLFGAVYAAMDVKKAALENRLYKVPGFAVVKIIVVDPDKPDVTP